MRQHYGKLPTRIRVEPFFYKDGSLVREVSRQEWFSTILKHLEHSKRTSIYLRDFKHPDEFNEINKDSLLSIMKLFLAHVAQNDTDFKIVAYRPDPSAKDPLGWLTTQLQYKNITKNDAKLRLSQCVKLISQQPSSNTSTVYVIDDMLIYNHSEGGKPFQYFINHLPASVIPHFIDVGITDLAKNSGGNK